MLREGITYEKKIWNEKGVVWMKELKHSKLNDFIELYEKIKEQEKAVQKEIGNFARMKEETALLMTIPGIGELKILCTM